MGLVDEIREARAELAGATYALADLKDSLEGKVGGSARGRTGDELRDLEARVDKAKADLERVEREVLERARVIVRDRDPAYAKRISEAHLLSEVEKSALIGAADRLSSE